MHPDTAKPADPALERRRIWSLDILRGLVIVLMALDHVRDMWSITPFIPEDLSQSNTAWFFTRWITHFCAPVFVFLAGTAAFLYGQKVDDRGQLSKFLLTRGLWLIVVELLVVNMSWTFQWPWVAGYVFVQVLWVIGWSMIVLAGLIWLPWRAILAFGLVLIAGHNLLDGLTPESFGPLAGLWQFLHVSFSFVPSVSVFVVYPLIPWIGVMAVGYVFGRVMLLSPEERRRWLLWLGLGGTALFLLLRLLNVYGDPAPWVVQEKGAWYTFLSVLNTTKYPPSLLFLLMTLGPAFLLMIPLENARGPLARFFRVFGRVPFFFYIFHFSFLTLTALLWHLVRYGEPVIFFNLQTEQWPADYVPNLGLTYLVWVLTIVVFYFLCRWYGRFKFSKKWWWLKYL